MIEIKNIKISTPKWKWWQVGIIIVLIILAFRINPNDGLELFNRIFK